METKEQKPWYHGHAPTVGSQNDALYVILGRGEASFWICRMIEGDHETQMRWANLFAAAPETATQRDELLSVQKQLLEALEAAEKAMERILPYLIWTVGEESPGHHPTLPSAVGAFKYSLNEEVRAAIQAAKASS